MVRGIALTLACVALPAVAQTETAAPPQQVVVNGAQTDVEAGRDFVAGKLIIGKQRIADSGVQNAGELLAREPAVSVGKDGRIGLLGMAGYTQVLVDGSTYAGDAFALDVTQIERIEIIKSSTAATGPFGIAGTINIVRRKVERKSLTQWRLGASGTAGRPGEDVSWADNQANAAGPFGYSLRLVATHKPSSAASRYVETGPAPVFDGAVLRTGEVQMIVPSADLAWTIDADDKLTLSPDALALKQANDGVELRRWPDGRVLAVRERGDGTMPTFSLPLLWNRQVDADTSLAVKLNLLNRSGGGQDSTRGEDGSATPPHAYRNDTDNRHRNRFLDLDYNTTLTGGHAISAGAKFARNDTTTRYTDLIDGVPDASLGVLGHASTARLQSGRLFVQDEWRVDRGLSLNLGVSAEHRAYQLDEGPVRNRPRFDFWSPSLHLAKKIGGDSKRQLRVSLARSFQAPFADQLLLHPTINSFALCASGRPCGANTIDTADSSGNPDLRPERALGLNVSYTQGLGKGSELVAEFYSRDIRDKTGTELALDNVAWASVARYVLRPANLGDARVRGVNLEGRVSGSDISKDMASLELHGSVGWADSRLSNLPGPDNRLAEQTPWRAKLGGSYTTQIVPVKWGVEASYLPGDWVRANLDQRIYQSDRRTLGVNASWKIDARSRLVFNLDNLLPRANTRIDDYLGAATSLRLTTDSENYARFSIRYEITL